MTIKEFFTHYYHVVCNENLDLLDQLYQTDSPFLLSIKNQYKALRQQVEMGIAIESIELVAKQEDLLVIRDNILFEGDKDGEVKRSRSGNLHVLTRKEQGDWKIHSTVCLAVSGV